MLKCNYCSKVGPENIFIKDKRSKTGYVNTCRACKSLIDKKYREKYKLEISGRRKRKYAKTKKPISRLIYIKEMKDNPVLWRAKILRGGMLERSKLKNFYFDKIYFTISRLQG